MEKHLYLFLSLLLLVLPSWASGQGVRETDINAMLEQCDARLETLQQQAESARWVANTFLLIGAAVAAIGSALAGFLTKTGIRKVMAVLGSVGAILAVVPKTLREPTEILARRMAAERHRTVAAKVVLQLPYLPRYENLGKRYVIARLIDCTSTEPSETVPPLPEPPRAVKEAEGASALRGMSEGLNPSVEGEVVGRANESLMPAPSIPARQVENADAPSEMDERIITRAPAHMGGDWRGAGSIDTGIKSAQGAGSTPEDTLTGLVRTALPEVEGSGVDAHGLDRYVKARLKVIGNCYERELKLNPSLSGKAVVRFGITPSGSTRSVEIVENTLGNEAVGNCIRTALLHWVFPFKPGSEVFVAYPFLFAPAR
ncbi:AgmX/PglI C-terminal domain-containing protein [Stigmatella sp. ncwal1]|uniref:AgmX/PglI C-terminal domain-containing protein n=1 Tax=Stigmatella ashevillensis TaxID=2995309 RepID=A0ABT5DFS7_9BACT|nr:AgmX/PglI C-terminal domain-containing protein [Stigmatella ashevillena]MDC0711211.1 AgmX/PglI C-terminal domain-containing protein [Stigmatella ashevillena]